MFVQEGFERVRNTYGKGGHPPPLAWVGGGGCCGRTRTRGGGGERERRIGGGRGADAEAEASSPHSISIYGQEGPLRLRGLGVLEGKRRGTYLLAGSGGRRRERVRHNEWCGVRGAIDSSFNLVATHPS